MGTAREGHRTAEPTVMRFLKEFQVFAEDVPVFCGVYVNGYNLGGKYGRIQEGYNQLDARSVG